MIVDVGQAETDLSELLARVEAGEDVEITHHGVPVARLVPVAVSPSAGRTFLVARGSLAGRIALGDGVELTDAG